MQCCVCGRVGSDVINCENTLTRKPAPYCLDCQLSGREPYEDLINFGWDFSWFNNTYQQKIIIPTLTFNNKTIQQFNDDVKKKRLENTQ